jgi:ABC-type multidrug transport system fused ATPase/permease subunit
VRAAFARAVLARFHSGTHDELIAKRGTYYQLYTGAFELE